MKKLAIWAAVAAGLYLLLTAKISPEGHAFVMGLAVGMGQ